jgi:hypothetical protein
VKDTALSRSSNSTTDHHSRVPGLNMKNIQTPTNSSVIGALPRSQASSSIRSSSSIHTKSNNIVILETFAEYRDLKRNYERVLKENETWFDDYKALTTRMNKLQQTSFRMCKYFPFH